MPQIGIQATCEKDKDGWWHPTGKGRIFTDRDSVGSGYHCNTPLVPQKQIPHPTEKYTIEKIIGPDGSTWIPRCEGKLLWQMENDTAISVCPVCGYEYKVELSG